MARAAPTLAVGLCLLSAGCGYYSASLLSGGSDASAQGDGAAGAGPATCEHAAAPAKPSVTDAGGELDLLLAMQSVAFLPDVDAGWYPGYDVDRTCTCQGENSSCLVPTWATASHCDGPQGRDNALGQLIAEFSAFFPAFDQAVSNADVRAGAFSSIARIRGYNGLPDDDQIELSWYALGSYWGAHKEADGGDAHPKWDGTDTWPVVYTSLEPIPLADGGVAFDLDRPLFTDKLAYVSAGVAVGNLPHGELKMSSTMKVVFTDVFVSARLVKGAQGWRAEDGVLSGAWALEDLFAQLGYVSISGIPICKGSPAYSMVKAKICAVADIYRNRGTANTPCDSMSIGMGFTGVEARFGPVEEPYSAPNNCTPDTDPATDSCGL
jgi:hypothetical protein